MQDAVHVQRRLGNSVLAAKTWVQAPEQSPQRLVDVSPAAVADASAWTVLSEGNCQFCTPCVAGKFNEGCDKQPQYEAGAPEGSCKPCLQSCNPGFFLLHSEKEAGCHEPPTHLHATDGADGSGTFATLEDYTCARCPTWVKQGQNLSIVSACGLQAPGDTYEHFNADPVNDVLQKTAKPVEPLARGEELLAGVPRKNFRGFMGSLKNYCPQYYFFDPQIPGCGFVNSGSPLAVSARKTVLVGLRRVPAGVLPGVQGLRACDAQEGHEQLAAVHGQLRRGRAGPLRRQVRARVLGGDCRHGRRGREALQAVLLVLRRRGVGGTTYIRQRTGGAAAPSACNSSEICALKYFASACWYAPIFQARLM